MFNIRSIPLKNIKAHPVRTFILALLAFAQAACFFSGINIFREMRQELSNAGERLGADVIVYPTAAASKISTKSLLMQGTPVEAYRGRSMLSGLESCEDILDVSCQIYISDTLSDGSRIWIYGYEPDTDFAISPWISGDKDTKPEKGSVLAGSAVETADDDTVMLYGREWPVAARLEETGSVLDTSVFASVDTIRDMISASISNGKDDYASLDPETDFSAALIRVYEKDKAQNAADWINIHIRKVTAVAGEETLTHTALGIPGTSGMMALTAGLIFVVLLLAMFITLSMLMKERTDEIRVWYSVGASQGIVRRMMLSEAFIIHLAGAVLGVLVMAFLSIITGGRLLRIDSISTGLSAAGFSIAVTVAAGIIFTYTALLSAANRRTV